MYLAFKSSWDCEALPTPALALPEDESGGEGNLDAPVSSAGGALAAVLAEYRGEAREDCCRLGGWFRGVELLE